MSISFKNNGSLVIGIHIMSLTAFENYFGYNNRRKELIEGLKKGICDLKACGCKTIYIDGSFVTKKTWPGDFDCCWDITDVDMVMLETNHPVFFDFTNKRQKQKDCYKGEFLPAQYPVDTWGTLFIDFFQRDKNDVPKGIIQINL